MERVALISGVAAWDPIPGVTPVPAGPWAVDHTPLLAIVGEAVREMGARYGALSQRTADGDVLANAVWATPDDGSTAQVVPQARAQVGYTLHGQRFDPAANPLWEEVYGQGRTALGSFRALNETVTPEAMIVSSQLLTGVAAGVIVPIVAERRTIGALNLYFDAEPGRALRAAATAYAGQLAQALRAEALALRLRGQLDTLADLRRRAVAAEERTRREIAAVLHGQAQSQLVVAATLVDQGARLIAEDPPAGRALLAQARALVDEVRERDLRPLAARLHPALIREGLLPALDALAERLAPALRVELRASPAARNWDERTSGARGGPRTSGQSAAAELRLAAFRIVEEALANVLRHAAATHAVVALELRDDELLVRVEDDGAGVDATRLTPGLGLASIADRVELAGGDWRLDSAPGAGTCLRARLPLT